jgi:nucleoside-diphosphate-sugar epimerase
VQAIGGFPPEHFISEDELPRPVTRYGVTKVFGETLGRYYHDKHGIEFIALRFGGFQPPENIPTVAWLRRCLLSPRDGREIIQRAIETPGIGYAIIHAFSKTDPERFSLRNMKELLNYEPQDDATEW